MKAAEYPLHKGLEAFFPEPELGHRKVVRLLEFCALGPRADSENCVNVGFSFNIGRCENKYTTFHTVYGLMVEKAGHKSRTRFTAFMAGTTDDGKRIHAMMAYTMEGSRMWGLITFSLKPFTLTFKPETHNTPKPPPEPPMTSTGTSR